MENQKLQKAEKIVKKHPKHFYWKIKNKLPGLFKQVKIEYEDKDSFSEGLYLFLYGKDKAECNYLECSNFCTFRSFSDGYRQFCSKKCSNKSQESKEVRECVVCNSKFEVKKSRSKKMCSRKCWREWNRREDIQREIQKRRRKTLKEKYGAETYRNVEKMKKTKKERYGNDSYNNIEKIKKTMQEEYGGIGFESEYISDKAKKTNLERYGVENPSELEEFKNKASLQKRKEGYKKLCSDEGRFEYVQPLFEFEDYKGRYNSQAIEYDFECLRCNTEFTDIVRHPMRPRCPNCFPLDQSKIEKDFQSFIVSFLDCPVQTNHYGFLKGNRELDVYIPSKNVAIEFNGIYWHSENGRGQCGENYHLNKTKECEDRGIQLIHVFENEWIEKKSVVKDRLKYILGEYGGEKVYARNTEISEVDPPTKNKFLNNNHLQGADRSNVKLGLHYEDDLVSLMTFSKRRLALGGDPKDDSWELSRFCSSCQVVGGASKLFKSFLRNCEVNEVVTYADRRWSSPVNDIFYERIGFDFDDFVRPSYFYFHESDRFNLKHRFNFRKNVLNEKLDDFDPNLTEWENMKRNGYNRIWDCGKIRYIWKNDT